MAINEAAIVEVNGYFVRRELKGLKNVSKRFKRCLLGIRLWMSALNLKREFLYIEK